MVKFDNAIKLRRDNIVSFFTKIKTNLKLKTNIEIKLNHDETWHNCGVKRIKNKSKI